MSTASTSPTKVITPTATLSYPSLATPRAMNDGQEPKYSAALIFAKGADLSKIRAAANAAADAAYPGKGIAMLQKGTLRTPLRTDWEEKGYPEGSVFINARSKTKPGAVYAHADPVTGKVAAIPEDRIATELYPGCQVRASLAAYAYDNSGNKGIAFALNNIQKVGEGTRLDGRKAAEDEFEVDLSAEPADLAALGL